MEKIRINRFGTVLRRLIGRNVVIAHSAAARAYLGKNKTSPCSVALEQPNDTDFVEFGSVLRSEYAVE